MTDGGEPMTGGAADNDYGKAAEIQGVYADRDFGGGGYYRGVGVDTAAGLDAGAGFG